MSISFSFSSHNFQKKEAIDNIKWTFSIQLFFLLLFNDIQQMFEHILWDSLIDVDFYLKIRQNQKLLRLLVRYREFHRRLKVFEEMFEKLSTLKRINSLQRSSCMNGKWIPHINRNRRRRERRKNRENHQLILIFIVYQ